MKKIIIFAIFTYFSNILFGQTTIQQDSKSLVTDKFLNVTFEEHSLTLTEEGKKTLDFIAERLNDSILSSKLDFMFIINPSTVEKKGLEFERVGEIINYLKDVCNVKTDRLLFTYESSHFKWFTANFIAMRKCY